MKNSRYINKITRADALWLLREIKDDSIDVVLTDPPYFLDKLDNGWNPEKVSSKANQYAVTSLPAGMKFEREQGRRFYEWYLAVSKEVFRVLKPGGFFFSFSSPRLYHRLASAVDDAGFEMRDAFVWLYTQNQAKAMGLDHFIRKMDTTAKQKTAMQKKLRGWKTPQLKSCFEPIAMAQKPVEGTYLANMTKHRVGLFNTNLRQGEGMFPANVFSVDAVNELIDRTFLIPKPTRTEKGPYNTHNTVKPLSLCEHLIRLSAFSPDAVVLDPFVGSGTTAVAAKNLGKRYIGIDSNEEYVQIAKRRLAEASRIPQKGSPRREPVQVRLL